MELPRVDDAAVVRGVARTLGVEFLELRFELGDEGREDFPVDQRVVLTHADLSRVEGLGPEETAGSQFGIRVFGDEGGVAAAELEGDGGECFGGLLGDDGADVGGAGVEDFVPFLVEEGGGFGDGTLDDGVVVGVEGFGDDLLEDGGAVGGAFGGLEDGGAAGADGADEGAERELDGEVEGAGGVLGRSYGRERDMVYAPDDQHGTERVLADARGHEAVREGDVLCLLVLCPAREVLLHEDDVVHAPRELGEVRLERGLAQVLLARLQDKVLIVLEGPVQLAQLHQTELERAGLVGDEALADARCDVGDVVDGRVLEAGEFGGHGGRCYQVGYSTQCIEGGRSSFVRYGMQSIGAIDVAASPFPVCLTVVEWPSRAARLVRRCLGMPKPRFQRLPALLGLARTHPASALFVRLLS